MSLSINAPNRSDGDVFKKIFNDHWDEFLILFPQYRSIHRTCEKDAGLWRRMGRLR